MRSNTHEFDVTRLRDAHGAMLKPAKGNAVPKRHERVISKRLVDALSVEDKDAIFWDLDLPGFGVRVYPSGTKSFIVNYRAGDSWRSGREAIDKY